MTRTSVLGKELVIRKAGRDTDVGRGRGRASERIRWPSAGVDDDEDVVVHQTVDGGANEVVAVRDGPMGDEDDGPAAVEVVPPVRQLDVTDVLAPVSMAAD